jgi:hypothetical protein
LSEALGQVRGGDVISAERKSVGMAGLDKALPLFRGHKLVAITRATEPALCKLSSASISRTKMNAIFRFASASATWPKIALGLLSTHIVLLAPGAEVHADTISAPHIDHRVHDL